MRKVLLLVLFFVALFSGFLFSSVKASYAAPAYYGSSTECLAGTGCATCTNTGTDQDPAWYCPAASGLVRGDCGPGYGAQLSDSGKYCNCVPIPGSTVAGPPGVCTIDTGSGPSTFQCKPDTCEAHWGSGQSATVGLGGLAGYSCADTRCEPAPHWGGLTGQCNCIPKGSINPHYKGSGPKPCLSGSESGIETAVGCIPIRNGNAFARWFLGWSIGLAGGIAFLLIIFASFQIMTAGGDPQKLQGGREVLTAAISGLVLIIFSVVLLQLIGVTILQIPGFGR